MHKLLELIQKVQKLWLDVVIDEYSIAIMLSPIYSLDRVKVFIYLCVFLRSNKHQIRQT